MKEKITYQDAGVDVKTGYEAVKKMKKYVEATKTPGVLSELGSFGGLFQLDLKGYKQPILVSGTDGVGTKLKIAFMMEKHNTVGIDLVAMCANDVLCQGARPLFFLDYIGTGKLDSNQAAQIVEGVAKGCKEANCALIGGETAEMPGFYEKGEYDLAGFCVGIVDKDQIITGKDIQPGDVLMGLPSSGLHSNGFSLVRKLFFEKEKIKVEQYLKELGDTLGNILLTPTRIYVKVILDLLERFSIKGLAHITGGGFIENIPRILPEGCRAYIDTDSFPIPSIFTLIEQLGRLEKKDLYHTFNMGIGMIIVVDPKEVDPITKFLENKGEEVYEIGKVGRGEKGVEL
ncbi:phosphoribosylformylglycinamidine cyclo-ligase [Garciella nitratireducens]|uniref:Phosphoribosylformylglycinamidine cyclo-ligase n=1 Tax=Garciella nitratireducens DSM 15102 TaxID=1121911 RepID=A0A1T4NCN0_9FIRM|nr:phosphoribosylformylglycinamidine cyclo-ligase [Garciella nitratireducens]SJZ77009.1 phosphoribosylformylglycinamidine cyclo-ligase [Garciella nitratireducens DSM 15102]